MDRKTETRPRIGIGVTTTPNRSEYIDTWRKNFEKVKPTSYHLHIHEDVITIEKLTPKQTTQQATVKVGVITKLIEENNWLLAASGAMFRTDRSSVVCDVLTDWFNKRVEYKNAMKKAYKSGDAVGRLNPFNTRVSYDVPNMSAPSTSSLGSGSANYITVNGAIDPEGTARTIINVLNNSQSRGTLGAGALAF